MSKKVSVIIPTYGGGEFLKRTVESLLNQTYANTEIIVVDDNGKNTKNQINTYNEIRQYIEDGKIKYLTHKENLNGSAARNTGINNSTGDYIALLDDDDEFFPDKIEKQVDILNELGDEYALTYCSTSYFKQNEKCGEMHVKNSTNYLYDLLMHKVTIGSSSLMIKKSVCQMLGGFDESFRRHQDWEFVVRVAAQYKIEASDFIGVKRHFEFRNEPKDVETMKKYREHYLAKMRPYIESFDIEEQNRIYDFERMDIAIQWLKRKEYKQFLDECKKTHRVINIIEFSINRIIKKVKISFFGIYSS